MYIITLSGYIIPCYLSVMMEEVRGRLEEGEKGQWRRLKEWKSKDGKDNVKKKEWKDNACITRCVCICVCFLFFLFVTMIIIEISSLTIQQSYLAIILFSIVSPYLCLFAIEVGHRGFTRCDGHAEGSPVHERRNDVWGH